MIQTVNKQFSLETNINDLKMERQISYWKQMILDHFFEYVQSEGHHTIHCILSYSKANEHFSREISINVLEMER